MKKNMFKKIICMALCAAMVMALGSVVVAGADNGEEFVVINDGLGRSGSVVTNVTLGDIHALMDQRMEAVVNNDAALFEEITDILRQKGVEETTTAEIAEFTGEVLPLYMGVQPFRVTTMVERFFTAVTFGGVRHEIMRVHETPIPNVDGPLNRSGITTVPSVTGSWRADALSIFGVVVSAVGGSVVGPIGTIQTVYGAMRDVGNILFPSNTILTGVRDATYNWIVAESVSLVFVLDRGVYVTAARYHRATYNVAATMWTQRLQNGVVVSNAIQMRGVPRTVQTSCWDNTAMALSAFNNNSVHNGSIQAITFRGTNGQNIRTQALYNPWNAGPR